MPAHRIFDRLHLDSTLERNTLIDSLLARPASIAPKYFYDALGCALFGAICELPEYYPTRTEAAIFRDHRESIVEAIGTGKQLIDLGAGDCRKAASWFPHLRPRRYVAVDIARGAIDEALARMAPEHPEIEMLGMVTDFSRHLDLSDLHDLDHDGGPLPATFFYPGSSIGNFDDHAALRFLTAVRAHCRTPGSGLLIGVDAKKERRLLEAAYDDAIGVTAAFNRNVLAHVNRLLSTEFNPAAFAHRAVYDEAHGRIEMYLEALEDQEVTIVGGVRRFTRGERIHTENSYKYAPAEFASLLKAAGFERIETWQDRARWFSVFHAE